jgi:putative transcriptional regulator
MTTLHDAHLLDYAAGSADPASALLAECAIAMRPETAERYNDAELIGGLYLEDGPISALRPEAFNAVLGLTTDPAQAETDETERAADVPRFPAPLERALARETRGDRIRWKRRPGGMSEMRLKSLSQGGIEARLVKLKPGGGVPGHDHAGDELTLVLEGAFSAEHGVYRQGDVCEAGPGVDHNPRVEGDMDCICLIVRRGGWRFNNPLIGALDRVLSLL